MSTQASSKTLRVGEVELTLLRSRRRTLTLEVDPNGVRARAPMRMSEADIIGFVQSKQTWLRKQLANLPAASTPLLLTSGAEVLLGGQRLQVRIDAGRSAIKQLGDNILSVPIVRSHLSEHETARRKLISWYKKVAHRQILMNLQQLMPEMQPNTALPRVRVRDYKRRWGSCAHDGSLSFNWRLAMAPPAVLRYVVVHELAHRQEFNHSKRFWKIVARHEPQWQELQAWLQRYGYELYRF